LVKSIQLIHLEHVQPKLAFVAMVIDHQMVVIQVHVGKNFIDDVLINGGFGVRT
jgi:hypothetical protein